jgi:hypothetical protein
VHDEKPAVELVRRQHLVKHRHCDPRIVTEPAYPSVAGIEPRVRACSRGERQVGTVILSNAATQRTVRGRSPELFDPGVLIGWYSLVRQLTADPLRLLGQDHPAPEARRGKGGGARAQPAADDRDLGTEYFHQFNQNATDVVRTAVP